MCGIFGLISSPESKLDTRQFKTLMDYMFTLSEARGKDASGLLLLNDAELTILKRPLRARQLLRTNEYRETVDVFAQKGRRHGETLGFMGHARMVTNGSEETHENNQPIIRREMCLLHNGIIVNDANLWTQFPEMERNYEVDTEAALSLIQRYRNAGQPIPEAFASTFAHLQGANSFAFVSSDWDAILLATSNGSLYFSVSPNGQELVFSSERYILVRALAHSAIKNLFDRALVVHIQPGEGYLFPFKNLTPEKILAFGQGLPYSANTQLRTLPRSIHDLCPTKKTLLPSLPFASVGTFRENELFIKRVNATVSGLKRCSKCILPETFPFIEFDENRVCNFCRHYQPLNFKGAEALEKLAATYRRTDGRPDCLVPISGGRDSCFGLHYAKNVLKLNPVAYTYDWGMVTDLARRNISRMCGALGVEHILVSADIKTKRKYVRQNVLAWLKRPTLGTVPLFMAGDKQFFYYAQMLKKQMDTDLAIFSFNRLERTDFKVGFANADESHKKSTLHNMTSMNKLQLMVYYAKEYIKNPAYINSSVPDTIFAFFSFYLIPKAFESLYDYIRWDEETVNNTLIQKYNWEIASDTQSTWRIGDGTASFYNYIYYVMAGFSENDTFRSNQIREGLLTREDALRMAERDNQPRYESIQWYCTAIGLEIESTLKIINATQKLYQ